MTELEVRAYLDMIRAITNECPREFNASRHMVDYHHRTNPDNGRIICLQAGAPDEIKALYPVFTRAQVELWDYKKEHPK